jgi:hypothetical protein
MLAKGPGIATGAPVGATLFVPAVKQKIRHLRSPWSILHRCFDYIPGPSWIDLIKGLEWAVYNLAHYAIGRFARLRGLAAVSGHHRPLLALVQASAGFDVDLSGLWPQLRDFAP